MRIIVFFASGAGALLDVLVRFASTERRRPFPPDRRRQGVT